MHTHTFTNKFFNISASTEQNLHPVFSHVVFTPFSLITLTHPLTLVALLCFVVFTVSLTLFGCVPSCTSSTTLLTLRQTHLLSFLSPSRYFPFTFNYLYIAITFHYHLLCLIPATPTQPALSSALFCNFLSLQSPT